MRVLTKRLLGYMRPFLHIFLGIVLTAFGRHGLFALISPLIVMLIIDYIVIPVPGRTHWFLELLKGWTGVEGQTEEAARREISDWCGEPDLVEAEDRAVIDVPGD